MSVTTGTFPGVRIVDMPDLGAFNDSSSVVGERAGSGRFNAIALRNYIGQPATINVRQFGAVGDGVADDTFAIQAAIDSLSAYGGGVAVPPGVYRITAGIKMRPNIVLQGNGGATIIQGNAANLSRFIDLDAYAATNATVTGIAFDGNIANNTPETPTTISSPRARTIRRLSTARSQTRPAIVCCYRALPPSSWATSSRSCSASP